MQFSNPLLSALCAHRRLASIAAAAFLLAAGLPAFAAPKGEVPDFAMLDYNGRFHQLRRADAKVVVLFFTSNGCPIARQSITRLRDLQEQFGDQGVRVWMVNSNSGDDRASIRKEAEEFGIAPLPVLLDDTQGVAAMLGVRRTGTVVCIETERWRVIYEGAIDDQLVEGAQKPEPTRNYLADALTQFLAGKPVETSSSAARGCIISVSKKPVSYSAEVAPILEQKCFTCHSPGNIGPLKMTSYKKVQGIADMIQEVVLARRMPPWHADPAHGHFVNDCSLTLEETRTLLRWIEQGAEQDEGSDPLAGAVAPSNEWKLGPPDLIVQLPEQQQIPATGVLDYRHIKATVPFTEDAWVKAAIAKPDNTRVVHHIIVRVREPGQNDDGPNDNRDDAFLLGWAPGAPEIFFPEGTGKLIKKGSVLDFEMHYTTSGRPEVDQSRIGIYLHKEKPAMRLKTRAAWNTEFEIPPGVVSPAFEAAFVFKKDSFLYDMSPHMHLRGHWFQFEAVYPDGTREMLLSVPRYDFAWQHTYRLVEPKRMSAGTRIICKGGFDNSSRNPANPNPNIPVRWGDQSFEEMFIGFMGVAEIPDSAPAAAPESLAKQQ